MSTIADQTFCSIALRIKLRSGGQPVGQPVINYVTSSAILAYGAPCASHGEAAGEWRCGAYIRG